MQSLAKASPLLTLQANWRRTGTSASLSRCSSLDGIVFLAFPVAWIVSEISQPWCKMWIRTSCFRVWLWTTWENPSQQDMMRLEDKQRNGGPNSTFNLYSLKNSFGSDNAMTAVMFVPFFKSNWLREASEKAGGKILAAIDCVHPSLSRTRKKHVGVDWFVYLASNVTFISGTLSIQSGRCLERQKNAKFNLEASARIWYDDSVGMSELETGCR